MDSTQSSNMNESPGSGFVLPGEYLGNAEEIAPGRGAYEYKGKIYAALMGEAHVEPESKTVTVRALHEIPHLSENDIVYARIEDIKPAMLVTTILCSATTGRVVPGYPDGTVHISKAKNSYVERLGDEFAIGDLLRAKVIAGYPAIKLSTQEPSLGVVSARCQDCHALLTKLEKGLYCPRCGKHENRHTAASFGHLE